MRTELLSTWTQFVKVIEKITRWVFCRTVCHARYCAYNICRRRHGPTASHRFVSSFKVAYAVYAGRIRNSGISRQLSDVLKHRCLESFYCTIVNSQWIKHNVATVICPQLVPLVNSSLFICTVPGPPNLYGLTPNLTRCPRIELLDMCIWPLSGMIMKQWQSLAACPLVDTAEVPPTSTKTLELTVRCPWTPADSVYSNGQRSLDELHLRAM